MQWSGLSKRFVQNPKHRPAFCQQTCSPSFIQSKPSNAYRSKSASGCCKLRAFVVRCQKSGRTSTHHSLLFAWCEKFESITSAMFWLTVVEFSSHSSAWQTTICICSAASSVHLGQWCENRLSFHSFLAALLETTRVTLLSWYLGHVKVHLQRWKFSRFSHPITPYFHPLLSSVLFFPPTLDPFYAKISNVSAKTFFNLILYRNTNFEAVVNKILFSILQFLFANLLKSNRNDVNF